MLRGSGRTRQVGSPKAHGADPTAKLLVHQWLQQLDRGRTSFGSTVASEVGSSWPTAHPVAWMESLLPCSGQDGPLADGRGEGTDTPASVPFPWSAWYLLRRQGWAERVRVNPLTICPWICRGSPAGSTAFPGRKPRRGRGARLCERGRGSHRSLGKTRRKVESSLVGRTGVGGPHPLGKAESRGWRSHSGGHGRHQWVLKRGGFLGCWTSRQVPAHPQLLWLAW